MLTPTSALHEANERENIALSWDKIVHLPIQFKGIEIHAQFEDLTCLEFIELLFTLLFSQDNCAFVVVTETDDRLKTCSPSAPM